MASEEQGNKNMQDLKMQTLEDPNMRKTSFNLIVLECIQVFACQFKTLITCLLHQVG